MEFRVMSNPLFSKSRRRTQGFGFTLVELLITITIAAILLAIGIPSFKSFTANQQVKNATFDLSSMLRFARSEAIKRNNNVVVTPVSSAWKNGWTITVTVSGTTTTLGQHDAFATGVSVTGPTTITYSGTGRLNAATAPSFGISNSSTRRTSTIGIDLSGLPKITSQN
jgi:type IV fimbrial biogenesis protein FimT